MEWRQPWHGGQSSRYAVFKATRKRSDVIKLNADTARPVSVMRRNMMQRMHVAGSMLPFPHLHIPPSTSTPACVWRLRRTQESWAM